MIQLRSIWRATTDAHNRHISEAMVIGRVSASDLVLSPVDLVSMTTREISIDSGHPSVKLLRISIRWLSAVSGRSLSSSGDHPHTPRALVLNDFFPLAKILHINIDLQIGLRKSLEVLDERDPVFLLRLFKLSVTLPILVPVLAKRILQLGRFVDFISLFKSKWPCRYVMVGGFQQNDIRSCHVGDHWFIFKIGGPVTAEILRVM